MPAPIWIVSILLIWKVGGTFQNSLFPEIPNVVQFTENEACKTDTEIYEEGLLNMTLWAHEMSDSSVKYANGVLSGNSIQMGNWEECLGVKGPFTTQYCLVTLIANVVPTTNSTLNNRSLYPFDSVLHKLQPPTDPTKKSRNTFHIALCLPASCNIQDIQHSLSTHLNNTRQNLVKGIRYDISLNDAVCQSKDPKKKPDRWDVIFCLVTAFIILLITTATLYDCLVDVKISPSCNDLKKHRLKTICLALSAKRNFLDLSKTSADHAELNVLNGIKTISLLIIILAHKFFMSTIGPLINYNYVEDSLHNPLNSIVLHGDLFVDTFFLMGGLLMSYGMLSSFCKQKISPMSIVLWRYMRLTPSYAYVVFFGATVYYFLGSGPLWEKMIANEIRDCRANWWTNLLYINNYVKTSAICIPTSWYLPCDFHFFLVGLTIMWTMTKNKLLAYAILILMFIISILIPFAQTIVNRWPAVYEFYPEKIALGKQDLFFLNNYVKTHNRAGPYFVGMFFGIYFHSYKSDAKKMSKLLSYSIMTTSCLILITVLLSGAIFYDPNRKYDVIEAAFYAPLSRVTWAVASGGVLMTASFGHSTLVRSFLSWPPFTWSSKLSYCAYLVHNHVQYIHIASLQAPQHLSNFRGAYGSLADISFSYILALLLYICIEAPAKELFKLVALPQKE